MPLFLNELYIKMICKNIRRNWLGNLRLPYKTGIDTSGKLLNVE